MAHEKFEGLPPDGPAAPESARKSDLSTGVLTDALSRFSAVVPPDEARELLPEGEPDEYWALALAAATLHIDAAAAGVSGWSYDLAA